MRLLRTIGWTLLVVACGAPAPEAPPAPAAVAFTQPPLRALAPAPRAPEVCLDDADAALDARLALDAVWAFDPVAGSMAQRGLGGPSSSPQAPVARRILTHSPETLRAGLARYLTAQGDNPGVRTAALVTYAGDGESCAWLMSADGVAAYGRSSVGADDVRADVARVLEILDVRGAMNARAPRLRSDATASAAGDLPALDVGALATALAHVAETATPAPVAAALGAFDSLIIVPHEGLLAFPALLLTAGRAEGPPVYLIDRVSLQIAPSLSEIGIGPGLHRSADADLATMTPQDRRAALARALIVGDPAYDDAEYAMPPLPGAAQEAEAVAQILGASALVGAAATWPAVQARLQERPRYIHFATHGLSDGEGASHADNRSFLALAGGGRFTAGDARATRMRDGAIVVLSACQSGLGASRPGGIVGLPRAFQLAGAQTVVMSLWNVDDAATGDLMRGFAQRLAETGRPASSFAAAVRDTRTRHPDPRHWAAFAMFGVARP
ncbi:MAG: CHAT domain-containing protein [Hyphomonadaceae bacterium]|nr:CHAT domain-containing protein [Hyphomonadaceae bacterium]